MSKKKITLAVLIFLTVILAGISIYVTIKLQESQAPNQTGAATGSYTNVCGTTNASWSNRDPQCQGCSPGTCSGNYVYKFLCYGRTNQCGGTGTTPYTQSGPSTSMSLGGEPCGVSVQIDTFTGANYTGLKDFFVYYTGDCEQVTPKYKCSGSSCVRDDAGGNYTDSNCNNQCQVVLTCPSSVQARFRVTVNGTDTGLHSTGTFKKSEVNSIDYTVVTNMQTNPPQFFNGTITVTGPGLNESYTGTASPRPINNIQAGTYVLSALVNGSKCDGATITITDVQRVTCYHCTPATNDGNACESVLAEGATCPSGWTTSSNCASVATGGACPVETPKITCYRCTSATNDANMCENQQFDGTSCPTGWTNNSNCAAAETGGSCPVVVSCGQTCTSNTQCPTDHSCSNGVCTKNSCLAPNVCNNACGTPIQCGQACQTGTNACPTGHTCNSGICKLNACLTPGACSDNSCTLAACGDAICNTGELCEKTSAGGTTYKECTSVGGAPTGADVPNCSMTGTNACRQVHQVSCGGACTTNANCAEGHTCNNNVCTLNACLTSGNCSDSCTPVVPVCGGSCTSNAQCPNDHSCVNNKCVLNGCTSSTCSNGCVPLCGGPCTSNAQCPNNHSCTAGKCVLNGCTASTCTNGCSVITVIPETGIEDDARLIVAGSILIVAGYSALKFRRKRLLGLDTNNYYEEVTVKNLKQKAEK